MLRQTTKVIATDIDESALSKLWYTTPKELRYKLKIEVFNILDRLPFPTSFFDGIFCAGTLHYFSERKLVKILREMNRVLKPHGRIILDFATDIKRIQPNGELIIRKGTPQYRLKAAKEMLKNLFNDFDLKYFASRVPKELIHKPGLVYTFSCRYLLLDATKK